VDDNHLAPVRFLDLQLTDSNIPGDSDVLEADVALVGLAKPLHCSAPRPQTSVRGCCPSAYAVTGIAVGRSAGESQNLLPKQRFARGFR
jgi:hypothetical protein